MTPESNYVQNIANRSLKIIKTHFEQCLRTVAVPPIKGEITHGKLIHRGIRRLISSTETWLEQRGREISPRIKTTYWGGI